MRKEILMGQGGGFFAEAIHPCVKNDVSSSNQETNQQSETIMQP